MAIFEKEKQPKKEHDEETPKRETSHVSANKLGKALATVMLVVIFVMLLLYFWPFISSL